MVFTCGQCYKTFHSQSGLLDHELIHRNMRVVCGEVNCRKTYSNFANLRRHDRNVHSVERERDRREERERRRREGEDRQKKEKMKEEMDKQNMQNMLQMETDRRKELQKKLEKLKNKSFKRE